jgi:hypothetical protein
MNPIGIALAFILFWAMVGLGLFLMANSLAKLGRQSGSFRAVAQAISAGATEVRVQIVVNLGLFIVGAVLAWLGASSVYTVIYK